MQHPNAGAVMVFGLGCENNTVKEFRAKLGDYDESRIKFLVAQEVADEIETGEAILEELLAVAKDDKREAISFKRTKSRLEMWRFRRFFWNHR